MVIEEYKNAIDGIEVKRFSAEELERTWRKKRKWRRAAGAGGFAAAFLVLFLTWGMFGGNNNLTVSVYAADGERQELSKAEVEYDLSLTVKDSIEADSDVNVTLSDLVFSLEGEGIKTIKVKSFEAKKTGEQFEYLISYGDEQLNTQPLPGSSLDMEFNQQMLEDNQLILTGINKQDGKDPFVDNEILLSLDVQYKDGKTEPVKIQIASSEETDSGVRIKLL